MSLVSFAEIRGGSVASITQAIRDSLDLINFYFEKEIKKVVIKPNMCYYWDYSTGQTTDPKFVAALIHILREKTSVNDIAIVESDASAMKCKYAFSFLGYEKLFQDHDTRLINLSQEESENVTVPCKGQSYSFQIPRIIRNADVRINLPKIKFTMKGIELTCAMKNIFGVNPYPRKYEYHSQLGNVIVALNKAMNFDLCIIDGNIVSGVQPRKLGLVMASRDPVAIDAAAARVAGINPGKIKYLRLANKEGLGNMNFIEKGASLTKFKSMYPKKTLAKKLMLHGVSLAIRLKLGKRLGLG